MSRLALAIAALALSVGLAACTQLPKAPGSAQAATPRPAFERYPHPDPRSPFARATRIGNMVLLSGQIGMRPDGTLPEDFDAQSRQVMENIRQDLAELGLGMDALAKCTVMLEDMSQWQRFNRIYVEFFPDGQLPARSAFGANALALGAASEVECIAYDGG